jgi:hypothetical protein
MTDEDLEGKKKLERMNKLLGTDHFDKKAVRPDKSKAQALPESSKDKGAIPTDEISESPGQITPSPTTQNEGVGHVGPINAQINTKGETMGQPGPVTSVVNTQDANVAQPGPVPMSVRVLPWEEHVTPPPVDAHPKVSWGMRVSIETYDFIKAHDSVRLQLEDKRTFKEKLQDWLEELKTEVTSELRVKPAQAPTTEKKDGVDSKASEISKDNL